MFFRNGFGVFVLLYQLGVTRAAGSSRTVDCDNDGQRAFYRFNATVDVTFHFDFAVTYFQNLFSVCDLRQTKFFCHLRTYLCRITVDSLTTADYNVALTDFADSSCQSVACSQRICTGKSAVS